MYSVYITFAVFSSIAFSIRCTASLATSLKNRVMGAAFIFFRTLASTNISCARALASFKSYSFVLARCHLPSTLKRHCHTLLRGRWKITNCLSTSVCVVDFCTVICLTFIKFIAYSQQLKRAIVRKRCVVFYRRKKSTYFYVSACFIWLFWWDGRDSNSRPTD